MFGSASISLRRLVFYCDVTTDVYRLGHIEKRPAAYNRYDFSMATSISEQGRLPTPPAVRAWRYIPPNSRMGGMDIPTLRKNDWATRGWSEVRYSISARDGGASGPDAVALIWVFELRWRILL